VELFNVRLAPTQRESSTIFIQPEYIKWEESTVSNHFSLAHRFHPQPNAIPFSPKQEMGSAATE
jgi:hypothetical protein